MDFEPTDEQRLVTETARAFTDDEIAARARRTAHGWVIIGRALTGVNALIPS